MAFEPSRQNDYYQQPPPPPTSTWPGIIANVGGHQYSSVNGAHELPMQPYTRSSRSFVSESDYPEEGGAYSSRTSMLHQDAPPPTRNVSRSHLERPWRPGFWERLPWSGILAIIVTVLATLACVVVLLKSHDVPILEWTGYFQPTVYISICTAIANIALTYALYEGVVISFWRKACQGATLTELHQYWHSGSSVWGAVQGFFQMRGKMTATACIFTVLSIARGPIMQRAASVKNAVINQEGDLTVFSAVQLPSGYAGINTGRTSTPSLMNPNFTSVLEAYANRDEITGNWTGCNANSTCYTKVKGFGFDVSCNTSGIPYFLDPINDNGTYLIRNSTQVFTADAGQFVISDYSGPASLLLNATFMGGVPTGAWNGSMIEHVCALRAGIVSYPITIDNNTISFQSSSWTNDTFLEPDDFRPLPYNAPSNLAGFILAAKALYYGTADFQFGGGVGWILNLEGASSNRYLQRPNSSLNYFEISENITWRDPMEDMINSMREIAFRTSLQIAAYNTSYENATQAVPYTGQITKTVYTVDTKIMWIAVAVSLLGVVAVIPTYRGFWLLGRPVSLSPLEIAKAFGAPILSSMPGNRPASDMLSDIGKGKVRYGDLGIVGDSGGPGAYPGGEQIRKIAIGPMSEVRPPQKGAKYL